MNFSVCKGILAALFLIVLASGCATAPKSYDYTAFREAKPRSIVVLPPLNSSPDVKATYSMLAQMSYPLAESGYYVLPVSLVDAAFKENGLSNAAEVHAVPTAKLREIFGADAALYVEVKSVTLGFEGTPVAAFPDAVTTRGAKHLRELAHLAREGTRAVQLYCVNLSGIDAVRPAREIDPHYAQALADAHEAGVEVLAYGAELSPEGMVLTRRLSLQL